MPDGAWTTFHDRARSILNSAGAEMYADAYYRGEWEGVGEDAAILYGAVDEDSISNVRDALAALAGEYGQDAIGMAVGDPALVGPG